MKNISSQKEALLQNTQSFAQGMSANNALLWGARGMGKSSLVKAMIKKLAPNYPNLKIIEITREDLSTLTLLVDFLQEQDARFILYCDDLSFDKSETSYKVLKTTLQGSLSNITNNILFYATSNRRHLIKRTMIDNKLATAINPGEAIEEKISLADRFGLWLGFHHATQDEYLAIIKAYYEYYTLPLSWEETKQHALQWAMSRGDRSGRVAEQAIYALAIKHNIKIDDKPLS